jgi:uncharacterized protein YuzE
VRWSFDAASDALYVRLSNASPTHQDELSDGTIVDLGSDDELVGVEILRLHRGWSPALLLERFNPPEHERAALTFVVDALSRPTPLVAGQLEPTPA